MSDPTDPKKQQQQPERRGPASPGSPDNMKGVEKGHSNPDGSKPELPTVTPKVPTDGNKDTDKED